MKGLQTKRGLYDYEEVSPMSSTMISSHIPDLDLITSYAQREGTFFSGVSPWTKFSGLILVILLVTLTRNLLICGVLYLIILGLYAFAGLPVKKLFAWYTLPVLFVISLVGLMAWTEPGTPLFSWNLGLFTLTLTENGLILVVTLLLKALISVTYSLFFLMTTRYQHFSAMIYRLFPTPLDQIFLLAYRFLFLTLSMTGSIFKAVRSRGGGIIHSIRIQGRIFAEVFALVFIRSFDRAERVHQAMIARGYNGKYEAGTDIPKPGLSGICVLGAFAGAIAVVVLMVPNTGGIW
jgi:cobalt/nickel transport system permease protein